MIIVFLTSNSGVIISARLQWIYGWRRKGYGLLPNPTQWLGFANRHQHSFRQWVWQSSSELAAARLAVQVEVELSLRDSVVQVPSPKLNLFFWILTFHTNVNIMRVFSLIYFSLSHSTWRWYIMNWNKNHRCRSRIQKQILFQSPLIWFVI